MINKPVSPAKGQNQESTHKYMNFLSKFYISSCNIAGV